MQYLDTVLLPSIFLILFYPNQGAHLGIDWSQTIISLSVQPGASSSGTGGFPLGQTGYLHG